MITTTVIGSMPKPKWLVQDDNIRLWRVSGEVLREGKDDAARISIQDQEAAGIDVITDGEQRRMHYISRFISTLAGIDPKQSNMADVGENTVNKTSPVVIGKIRREHPHALEDLRFLKANTDRRVKMTLPGPMTAMMPLEDKHYEREPDLAMALADALREEILDLEADGCDVIQLDEPGAIVRPDAFREWGRMAIDRAFEGIEATTCIHLCFGYRQPGPTSTVRDRSAIDRLVSILPDLGSCRAKQLAFECACSGLPPEFFSPLPDDKQIVFGGVDNACTVVEDPAQVGARLKQAAKVLGRDRIWAAPDCGFVWLPIEIARAKLRVLSEGAALA